MKLMNSIRKTFGLDEEEFEEMEDFREENEPMETEIINENVIRPGAFRRKEKEERNTESQLAPSDRNRQSVSIVTPKSFDEALKVSEEFMEGRIIIINTADMEIRTAQRFLDFVSGTSFAVGGDINRVQDNIYIVTPKNIDVTNPGAKDSAFRSLFSF